ncbi:MAG TPA: dTDP-4-dehydrorhamnose 3,5-epimerase family protein [Candidatus Limnocylindria bacterium]|nr:dTDP-4-dehydrorhamnose 3,5-epimerase family protein [Candidatus Limnocylindria bacterium]
MQLIKTDIDGVLQAQPDIHGDERGFFIETYRRQWFPNGREMIQGNRGDRKAGSIVGFHYHLHQADYWYVPFGSARVILHDFRKDSPTFGVTATFDLGADLKSPDDPKKFNHNGLYIPPGVAHGFAALSDMTITYLVDGYYNPADELGIAWNDPDVGADWGLKDPVASDRDKKNPLRKDIPIELRPHFKLRG